MAAVQLNLARQVLRKIVYLDRRLASPKYTIARATGDVGCDPLLN
jgi:hypothetical protein